MKLQPQEKDFRRILDIVRKAEGSASQILSLGRRMAKTITHADKAFRRAEAAARYRQHELAAVFYIRFGELKGQ